MRAHDSWSVVGLKWEVSIKLALCACPKQTAQHSHLKEEKLDSARGRLPAARLPTLKTLETKRGTVRNRSHGYYSPWFLLSPWEQLNRNQSNWGYLADLIITIITTITFPRLAMNPIQQKKKNNNESKNTFSNCNKNRIEEVRELGGEKKLLEVFVSASD